MTKNRWLELQLIISKIIEIIQHSFYCTYVLIFSYLNVAAMGIGMYTIILFNLERYLVISLPLRNVAIAKYIIRKTRYIFLSLGILLSLPILKFATVKQNQCAYTLIWKPVSELIFSISFLFSGGIYIGGLIIFFPVFSILLSFQIKKIMNNSSILLQNNPNLKFREIKLHLSQIYIAVYVLICLFPNVSYFIVNVGMPIYNIICELKVSFKF